MKKVCKRADISVCGNCVGWFMEAVKFEYELSVSKMNRERRATQESIKNKLKV